MYERFEKLYERWHLFLNSTAITAVLPTKTKQSIVSSVISYKAALAGSLVIKVDADYSSKACSTCGHTEDVRLGVFCCSPAFTLCSNCLVLSAVDRHFPPDIAGVATWVATFFVVFLVSCHRFSRGYRRFHTTACLAYIDRDD